MTEAHEQGYYGDMAMEVDAMGRRKVSDKERERRKVDKACYRCGDKGHFAYQCPGGKRNQAAGQQQRTYAPHRKINELRTNETNTSDTASVAGGVRLEELKD